MLNDKAPGVCTKRYSNSGTEDAVSTSARPYIAVASVQAALAGKTVSAGVKTLILGNIGGSIGALTPPASMRASKLVTSVDPRPRKGKTTSRRGLEHRNLVSDH